MQVYTPDAQWVFVDDSGTAKLLVRVTTDTSELKFYSTPLIVDGPIPVDGGIPL
jgi:hypothetical protein